MLFIFFFLLYIGDDVDLFRSVVSNYEERQKDLLSENTGYRRGLIDLQRHLVDMLRTSELKTSSSEVSVFSYKLFFVFYGLRSIETNSHCSYLFD